MKQSIQVAMLPTEFNNNALIDLFLDGTIKLSNASLGEKWAEEKGSWQPQHLYVTVSQYVENIKDGDWFIPKGHINPHKCIGFNKINGDIESSNGLCYDISKCRKIIATTNPKLLKEHDDTVPYPKMRSTGIAKVQQSFLKEFISNPDGKWEVEYDDINPSLFVNQDNTVNITSVKSTLPPFLYRNSYGDILIGYHGDTDVTEEWNNWIKENL